MNITITIVLILVAIIALLLIIALFAKKDYGVEQEITINKPKQIVFDYIKLLKNQDNFSKWATMDPDMKKDYRGSDGTEGFVSAWDSNKKNVGKGEQTIKKITEGESIDFDLHFMKPFEAKANVSMTSKSISENLTIVNWSFNSRMKYPMNLMLLTMNMEKAISDDFLTGLKNLKKILEK